jgi:tetratricopeptide (TPR) repeat protein
LIQLKDYRAAEPWLLKALEMKPRDRATLSSLSAVYIGQKRYRDAVDLLKPFVDTGRGTVPIHNNLAAAYRHLGLYRLGIEQLQLALEKDPDSAESHDNLGVLLGKTGKTNRR